MIDVDMKKYIEFIDSADYPLEEAIRYQARCIEAVLIDGPLPGEIINDGFIQLFLMLFEDYFLNIDRSEINSKVELLNQTEAKVDAIS
jgi:hypothetical protein